MGPAANMLGQCSAFRGLTWQGKAPTAPAVPSLVRVHAGRCCNQLQVPQRKLLPQVSAGVYAVVAGRAILSCLGSGLPIASSACSTRKRLVDNFR
jgi:hypothetical protein